MISDRHKAGKLLELVESGSQKPFLIYNIQGELLKKSAAFWQQYPHDLLTREFPDNFVLESRLIADFIASNKREMGFEFNWKGEKLESIIYKLSIGNDSLLLIEFPEKDVISKGQSELLGRQFHMYLIDSVGLILDDLSGAANKSDSIDHITTIFQKFKFEQGHKEQLIKGNEVKGLCSTVSEPIRNYQFVHRKLPSLKGDIRLLVFDSINSPESEYLQLESGNLSSIFDQLHESVVLVDFNSRKIVDCNLATTSFLGYEKDEIIGKSTRLFYPSQKSYEYYGSLVREKGVLDKPINIQLRVKNRKGKSFWIETRVIKFDSTKGSPKLMLISRNIEHQKSTEITLSRYRQKFQTLSELTGQLSYQLEIESGKIEWSGATEAVTGYSYLEMKPLNLDYWVNHIHPEQKERVHRDLIKCIDEKSEFISEYWFRDREGVYRLVEDKGVVAKDKESGKWLLLGRMRDITEEKAFQTQMAESEKSFRYLFDNSSDLIFILDPNAKIVQYNKTAKELLQIQNQLRGKSFKSHLKNLSESDLNKFQEFLGDEEGKGIRINSDFEVKDISLPLELDIKHGIYFDESVIMVYARDLRERLKTEDALQRSELLYDQLFLNAPVGIVLLNEDNTIKSVNAAFESIFGYKEENIKGKDLDQIIASQEYFSEAHNLSNLSFKGESFYSECKRKRADGKEIDVALFGVPVERNDKIENIFGIYLDISARKRAEADLKKRTRELVKSNASLEQFAYVTSHNLRAPVVNLESLLQLLDYKVDNDENAEILDKIEFSVQELKSTLTDLNQVVGSQKHKESQKAEKIAIRDFLESIKRSINEQIEASKAKIISKIEIDHFHYYKSDLRSILQNLLTNAIKYRHPDREPEIELNIFRENEEIIISVADNGLGIDLEKHGDTIFGLYKRFHSHVSGKGLGLHLIKNQIEAYGGRIQVESELEKGTTFRIFLKDLRNF